MTQYEIFVGLLQMNWKADHSFQPAVTTHLSPKWLFAIKNYE